MRDQNRRIYKIALSGNPNCGKTSIFNALAGTHQHVGNYPGVTVEKRTSRINWGEQAVELIDLPGTYSLSVLTLDEKVARDFILREEPDAVINVVDSGNLERNLFLTTQLLEMGVDVVIDLNMWDEAEKSGLEIDVEKLSELTGAPVVKTIGHRRSGIDQLIKATLDLLNDKQPGHHHPPVTYGQLIDDRLVDLARLLGESGCNRLPSRWYAVSLLDETTTIAEMDCLHPNSKEQVDAKLQEAKEHIGKTTNQALTEVINDGRYGFVNGLLKAVMKKGAGDRMAISRRIDNVLTHRLLGFPIFLAFIWLLFQATFAIGDYPVQWIDAGIGLLQQLIATHLPAGLIADLLSEGIIGGVGSVMVFLPNILILFLGIAILEDSGYMSRAAFIMDRLMRAIGLQGKAFIPMLMGFGCNVPAIMATRTLESSRQRILTVILIPFMSCAARLPVFILFAAAFFAGNAGNIIFLMYIIGVIIAILIGRILRLVLFKGEEVAFVMELPPYRLPTARAALIHMWERGQVYLKKMGGVILVASVILWFLGAFPKVDEYSQAFQTQIAELEVGTIPGGEERIAQLEAQMALEDVQHSFIGRLGDWIEPVGQPLGFTWQMDISLISGFIAKEVVVSSMGVIYQLGDEVTEESSSLIAALHDPINGITPLTAFGFMLFVLLYTPCITVVVAIRREIGVRWMWVSLALQLTVAWIAAFLVYQMGTLFGLG